MLKCYLAGSVNLKNYVRLGSLIHSFIQQVFIYWMLLCSDEPNRFGPCLIDFTVKYEKYEKLIR